MCLSKQFRKLCAVKMNSKLRRQARGVGRKNWKMGRRDPDTDLWAHGYGRAALDRMMRIHPVLEAAFRKMTAQLDDSVRFSLGNLDEVLSIRPFAPGDAELESFELLARAVRERRVVRFTYRKHGQLNRVQKRVHPYHIAYVN